MGIVKARWVAAAIVIWSMVLGPALVPQAKAQVAPALAPQGEWSPTTRYVKDDLVTSRGSTWRALRVNRNKVPGQTRPSTAIYWEQFAAGLNPLGAWDASTKYHLDDLVTHRGSAWRALRTNRSDVPHRRPADWEEFAAEGSRGRRGATGPRGPQGEQGPQGDQGPKGDTGATGATGATGPAGQNGAQGPQGVAGAEGPKGLQWRGAWNGASDYVTDDAVQFEGNAYVALQASTDQNPASEPLHWSLLAKKGDKGDTGDKGDKGDQGDIGPAGQQGADGPPGPEGAAGAAGPVGPQGPQGPQGPAGPNSVPFGSLAAPAIHFEVSPNTGIFMPEFAKIALAAGGTLFLHNIGTGNTALGERALPDGITGGANTAIGTFALENNESAGGRNTAVGNSALRDNTTGQSNTALGYSSLLSNTTGDNNTAVGQFALGSTTMGNQNTAVGSFGAPRQYLRSRQRRRGDRSAGEQHHRPSQHRRGGICAP